MMSDFSTEITEGADCWRTEHADRVSVMTDTAAYFRAFVDAASKAEKSLLIIAWDIDSRVELLREGGESLTLRDFLVSLASSHSELQIKVLCWDAALVYAVEREPLKRLTLGLSTPSNLRFELDSSRPTGVSLHQKLVVVDDRVAFSGGIDLTRERWDTSDHEPGDPRRVAPDDEQYGPFHDVQVAVDSDCARALAQIARARWEEATGERLAGVRRSDDAERWPDSLQPDFRDVDVCIARTLPPTDGDAITEIENRYLVMLASAKTRVYIETQYLTSDRIRDALREMLDRERGPEVTIVTPRRTPGLTEQATVGVARWNVIKALREADVHGRLRIVHPVVRGDLDDEVDTYVHSKVCVIDDRFFHVGSANLTTRSLQLDYECDLSIDADAERREAVEHVLARLLDVHIEDSVERIRRRLRSDPSIHALLDAQSSEAKRRLVPLESEGPMHSFGLEAYADPAQPLHPDTVAADLLDEEEEASRPFLRITVLLVVTIGIAAAWRWTPLRDVVDPDQLAAWFEPLRGTVWGPVVAYLSYTVLAIVGVPASLLILACGVTLGPWLGSACAMAGAASSAFLSFMIGRRTGRKALEDLPWSESAESIHRRIADRGMVAVAALRIIPVAPFFVINLVAGASKISLRDFMIATVVAMAPGTVVMAYYGSQLLEFLRGASLLTLVAVAVIVVAVAGITLWAERKLDRPRQARGGGEA